MSGPGQGPAGWILDGAEESTNLAGKESKILEVVVNKLCGMDLQVSHIVVAKWRGHGAM